MYASESQFGDGWSSTTYVDNYWIPVESTVRKVEARLRLTYKKTDNTVRKRVFDVQGFSRGPEGYHVEGFCHLRKKIITLSTRGIVEAHDDETGNHIPDVCAFLEAKYSGTVEEIKDRVFDDYGWAISALIYLANTDKEVDEQERAIIVQFVKTVVGDPRLNEPWIDNTISRWYRPGKMEVRNRVKEAAEQGARYALISEYVTQLQECQTATDREYSVFSDYLKNRLR